ncbi:ABC transporter permease [uncultured Helicobacter sp.]|uniref:MlaE family ABC transporter permease n=1 Tax=uncultured Helicobacter sp. TaxID=175537 RepID=UPI0026344D80|nr:ABC transporter permease [uncultured Helicobacter sp.]
MQASLEISYDSTSAVVLLGGVWDKDLSRHILRRLESVWDSIAKARRESQSVAVCIRLKDSFDLDFCGGEILLRWLEDLKHQTKIKLEDSQNALLISQKSKRILTILQDKKAPDKTAITREFIQWHLDTFKILKNWSNNALMTFGFLGEMIYNFLIGLINPTNIRLKALLFQVQEALIKAIPIVSLACFLIGIVVAYQGSLQLEQFGASILIVEMSSMLTLREMAPIITAIIIAGRSASAFSAEIGMMRATQEIDAMNVMGFNPINFLVLPRVIALCAVLPLVVFIADIFGLIGAMFVSQMQLGISSEQFIERFLQMVEMRHFWIGFLKAPFFGLIIALIGCYHGFIVAKDTRSIGIHTTKSVVESIFCVIAFDALCSVLFTQIGW